jgi:hypothetical protein
MRILLLILLLLAGPAWANEIGWAPYESAALGIDAGVPPGFAAMHADQFVRHDRGQVLNFLAAPVGGAGFEGAVAERVSAAQAEGWNLAAQTITPTWAEFSGVIGQRMMVTRLVALCGGDRLGGFTMVYSAAHGAEMRATLERLGQRLRARGC